MNDRVRFGRNKTDAKAIGAHLRLCDADFAHPLSTRVDIDRYAEKLAAEAERFEAWVEGDLVGLVAAYCNRPERGAAFVSSVSVLRGYRGSGVAAKLMRECYVCAAAAGFERIELHVDAESAAARSFYGRLGFQTLMADGEGLVLHRSTTAGQEGCDTA